MEKLNEDILKRLIREREAEKVSQEIEDLNEKGRRYQLRYVYQLVKRLKMFPDCAKYAQPKCDVKAEELRNKGNSYFANQQFVSSIEHYNKSICFAQQEGSDQYNLSVSIANRSAAFFKLKLYRECLESIRLAKEKNYPDALLPKLQKRESNCLEMLNRNRKNEVKNKVNFRPKLSYPANKKVPFLVDCLKWKVSDDLGRHVITERKLNPGDIIAFEEPYSTCILPTFRYRRCSNCLIELQHLLIPCRNCTQVMFCSTECEQEAQENFHKIECPVIDTLYEICTEGVLIALRTVLTTFKEFNSFMEFQDYVDKIDCKNVNVFTTDYRKGATKKDKYQPVHTLITNEDIINRPLKFRKFVFAAIVLHIFQNYTCLQDYLTSEEDENFFMEIMYHHMLTAQMNMHGMDTINPFAEDQNTSDTSYGSGSFPFLSLCNHSCLPNTVRLPFGKNFAVLVLRPIASGGHIWDNYGIHHCISTLEERQSKLLTQYQFSCRCEACEKNLPLYKGLPVPKDVPDCRTDDDLVENALQFKWNYGKSGIPRFSKYLKDYSKFSPCAQLCRAEEYLKFCFQILAGNISLEMRFQQP